MPYADRKAELKHKREEYAKDPEKFKTKIKEWRLRNPDKRRNRVRSALFKFCNSRGLTIAQGREILARKTVCGLCGGAGELHLDHEIPKSRGGGNSPENLQWLCPPCNQGKGSFTTAEFLAHIRKILARQ